MIMNYETIKAIASDQGISVKDLCALAPKNDPFYTGRPSEEKAAEWFTDLYRRFGYTTGVHLRRIHYRIVSQETPVERPDSKPYLNTEKDWSYLNEASKWARYLGLVPPAYFVDRRNPEAIIHARWADPEDLFYEDPTPDYTVEQYEDEDADTELYLPDLPDLPDLPSNPDFNISGYESIEQPYHIEIWCEKTTMNDVLDRVCLQYGCNLITGAGEMSITSVVEFLKRTRAADRPARILYISDYDPAGLGMPISVARKIEYFQRNEGFYNLDIRLHPICLTKEQVSYFDLPRTPVKDSDLRKANFEAAHGRGQVELDALEALHPGELESIVRENVLYYYDTSLTSRANRVKRDLESHLGDVRQAVTDEMQDELLQIEMGYSALLEQYEETREEYRQATEDFNQDLVRHQVNLNDLLQQMEGYNNTLTAELKQRAEDEIDMADYSLPEPDLPEEIDNPLYLSGRSYADQLLVYKYYRNGVEQ